MIEVKHPMFTQPQGEMPDAVRALRTSIATQLERFDSTDDLRAETIWSDVEDRVVAFCRVLHDDADYHTEPIVLMGWVTFRRLAWTKKLNEEIRVALERRLGGQVANASKPRNELRAIEVLAEQFIQALGKSVAM
jgi:hypothetical protein